MKLESVLKLPEFEKDLKALLKRFRSLESDLDIFIQYQLTIYHLLGIDNGGIERIPGLGISHPGIYKARKFACRALKGRGANSGIRVIYAYDESAKAICLIEIYFKGDQENEDKARIRRYIETVFK
jgi:mRNA-degrading endonuclease RelE of RelBE toxin-antitoxin system